MTKLRSAPGKRAWILVPQAALVVTGLLALVAVMNEWIGVTAGVLLFVAALTASMIGWFLTMRSFSCPNCAGDLRAPRGWWYRLPGEPILFRCAKCDTDWDVGLRGHED